MKKWIAFVAVGLFAAYVQSQDQRLAWPQFRGPGGSGVAEGQKPPVEFGPDKNLKWKVPAPSGFSSPIVAGDKLVITAFDGGKLYTVAYNRLDGKEAWRKEANAKKIEPYFKKVGNPAQSTSATDGERIVSYFGSCGLISYDLSGNELWTFEMPTATGGFGTGTSPILADGLVVVVQDEMKGSKIFALNAVTGKIQWEKKRLSPMSYGTPVVWDTPAGKQVVAAGHARMIGYDLTSGDEKWSVAGMPSGVCSSPVAVEGTLLFAGWSPGGPDDKDFQMPTFDALLQMADDNGDGFLSNEEAQKTFLKDFFEGNDLNKDGKLARDEWDSTLKFMAEGKSSAFALKAGGSGDVTKSHVLWKTTKGLPYIASGIAYRGQYVMVKDGGLVTAYDAKSGKVIYLQERALAEGEYYASPVAANGHIFFTSLDNGVITVLKAGTAKPEVVAQNPELGERVAATPAIADNTLYVRTAGHLYAFATKK
ncbi:MAG: PQQ-binding-like beta-propeller repeat protein [Gemmataceae bacterium]|nr:PQQ-binding-like beta-propeller repeat protein [Gemmataceae bacterium]